MQNKTGLSVRQVPAAKLVAWGLFSLPLLLLLAPPLQAASPRVVITPAAGYTITWDGNNGGFYSPDAGAGPSNNIALAANGTTAFASSEYGGPHQAVHLNDGLYGNSHSWLSATNNWGIPQFCGLRFAGSVDVSSIAWSRDNGDATEAACGGTCTDRAVGTYTLQYTAVTDPPPDENTAETGDPGTGWATFGTIEYLPGTDDATFSAYLRHRFDIAQAGNPIAATALRIIVSLGSMAIDEVEVNPIPDPAPPLGNFIEIIPASGYSIAWDRNEGDFGTPASPAPVPENDASPNRGAVAFTSSDLGPAIGVAFHRSINLNDGFYGNSHSWIPNFVGGDPAPFAGINFGRRLLLQSIAWGRDNGDVAGDCCGGTLTDRALGLYVLQYTTAPNPGTATPEACGSNPEAGWVTIGTINYKADFAAVFNSYLRHRFDLAQTAGSLVATGIRIKVPNDQTDIDEIEVNANQAFEQNVVRITNAPGFTIVWDGNDGQFNDPAVGAAPPPNRALASAGTTPFASSELGPVLGIPYHRAVNLNDGLYGNNRSWISAGGLDPSLDPDPFAGLNFGEAIVITNIAWSRDNGNAVADDCGGTCTDRTLGTYRLQYTTWSAPDATTPETGDPATGWADLGTITYVRAIAPSFTPYLRHRFDIASAAGPLTATGLRIKVPNPAIDIDEIEVNTAVTAPPPLPAMEINPATGYSITWDGNDGQFFDPAVGAAAPPNRALASQGSTAFGSSELGEVLGISFHRWINANDGLYGNSHSWISADGLGGNTDPDPWLGVSFGDSISITNLAWGRDNGDSVTSFFTDRSLGTYTLQVTMVSAPDATTPDTGDPSTGWTTIGTVLYRRADPVNFHPHLRHRFDVSAAGAPIDATALRIKVSDGNTDIDEIEVNTLVSVPAFAISIERSGDQAILSWSGTGGLQSAPTVTGPWSCLPGATSPFPVSTQASQMMFYRVHP